MRGLLYINIIVLLLNNISLPAQIHSTVDERMELQSIVFRLAGAQEFVNNDFKEYSDAVDKYFYKYSDHEIIRFIQEIRSRKNIAYSLIPASTPMLEIKENGVVSKMENAYGPAAAVWGEEWDRYVQLLNDFYRKSRFNKFFSSQSETYRKAIADIDKMLAGIDSSWFAETFGYYLEPRVYLCMANGQHNYSFTDSTAKGAYGIALGYSPMPFYYNIIHEMMHRYTAISDDYFPKAESAMTRIFENKRLVERYRQNAYPQKSAVFNEWITDLAVIMYNIATDTVDGGRQRVLNDISRAEGIYGYIWMGRSVEFMDNFYDDRNSYPYFQDFMPRLCEFLRFTTKTDNWIKVLEENDRPHPYVKSVYPVNGSNLAEYKSLKEVRIHFSEPMNSCFGFAGVYPEEKEEWLFNLESAYWENDKTFVVPINAKNLDKSDYFKLVLRKSGMISSLRMMAIETDYEIEYFVND